MFENKKKNLCTSCIFRDHINKKCETRNLIGESLKKIMIKTKIITHAKIDILVCEKYTKGKKVGEINMEKLNFKDIGPKNKKTGYFRPAIGQTIRIEILSEIYNMKEGEVLEGYTANDKGNFVVVQDEVENKKELMYIHTVLAREIVSIAMRAGLKSLIGLRFQATRKENISLKNGRSLAQFENIEFLGEGETLIKAKIDKIGSVEGRLEIDIEHTIKKHFKDGVTAKDVALVTTKFREDYKEYDKIDPMNLIYTVLKVIEKVNKEK